VVRYLGVAAANNTRTSVCSSRHGGEKYEHNGQTYQHGERRSVCATVKTTSTREYVREPYEYLAKEEGEGRKKEEKRGKTLLLINQQQKL
jgi:hypothetical protein